MMTGAMQIAKQIELCTRSHGQRVRWPLQLSGSRTAISACSPQEPLNCPSIITLFSFHCPLIQYKATSKRRRQRPTIGCHRYTTALITLSATFRQSVRNVAYASALPCTVLYVGSSLIVLYLDDDLSWCLFPRRQS